jgi:hypothetical protein
MTQKTPFNDFKRSAALQNNIHGRKPIASFAQTRRFPTVIIVGSLLLITALGAYWMSASSKSAGPETLAKGETGPLKTVMIPLPPITNPEPSKKV